MGRASAERSDETLRAMAIRSSRKFLADLRREGVAPPASIAPETDFADMRGRRVRPPETSSGCSSSFAW
jgi:hypothetical protein